MRDSVSLAERVEATRRDIADRLTPNALYEADYETEWVRRTMADLCDYIAVLRAQQEGR